MKADVSLMSGAGNTFVVLDNRKYRLSVQEGSELAQTLCAGNSELPRTEGMMLLDAAEAASGKHFAMNFFNPDGSHGAMCGNGGRCAVRFAEVHNFFTVARTSEIHFSTLETDYKAELNRMGNTIRLFFPPPEEIDYPILLTFSPEERFTIGFVNVGSDHAVVWFPEASAAIRASFINFDIDVWGSRVRHHKQFIRGANANFYTIVGEQTLRLRTFERGVEAETGACGTGAISTAIIAYLRHDIQPPVRIVPPSGEELIVNFSLRHDEFCEISLEGSANLIKTVQIEI